VDPTDEGEISTLQVTWDITNGARVKKAEFHYDRD